MDNNLKYKSLFIAIAPNHISNFENMINNNPDLIPSILLNPGHFNFNTKVWSKVINGSMNLTYTKSSILGQSYYQFKKILGYKLYLKKVAKTIQINESYDFYYCNLDDVLTNHIFYQLKKNKSGSFYVVEDGILNYYYPKINFKSLKFKRILSRFFLLNFIESHTHPTNINSNSVKQQFVRLPNKAIFPEKSIQLPFKVIEYSPDNDRVLIIGQDIMQNCKEGEQYYKTRLNELLKRVKENSGKRKIVYKPHRNGNIKIAEALLKANFDNFEFFKTIEPIEECIHTLRPQIIYSFESSAMINLKIGSNNDKISFFVLPFREEEMNLLNLYRDLGINILK